MGQMNLNDIYFIYAAVDFLCEIDESFKSEK